jgi:oligopeptide transport system permease protein
MLRYIVRRLLWLVPVLFAVSLITFVLMHMVPGGPWDVMGGGRIIRPEVRKLIAEKYGLDKPLAQQYIDYVVSALHGDLGPSYFGTQTVNQMIGIGFPVTATLGLFALGSAILVGIPLGVLAALRQNGALDRITIFGVTMGISIPNFVTALFLIIILCVHLRILPLKFQLDDWQTWVLPAFLLALRPIASLVRLTRSATLDILNEDYVRTARAKGLPSFLINGRHVLRNALIPVITLIGPMTADLVTGSFIIESIFSVPGIGRLFVQSVFQRNYSVFMGITLFYAVIVVFFNLAVDLTYSFLDPRIARS